MRRIFLTSTIRQSFVEEDAAILGRRFVLDFFVGSGPFGAIRMFAGAARADCTVCWFASVYSWVVTLAATLFSRRCVIVVGGVDAAAIRELDYGIWLSRWKSALARRALRRADLILAVDESLAVSLRTLSRLPLEHLRVLPTGYDVSFWTPSPETTPRQGVLCVATCDSERRARIKGIDLLLEAAAALPDVPFTIVGVAKEFIDNFPFALSANVRLLPPVPRDALREHYRAAALYCQPSRHEGLPNALCEAMLCGTIPVGAGVGGVAKAIGDCGVVVEPGSAEALRIGIANALTLPGDARRCGRDRIARTFPKEAREKGLIAAVEARQEGSDVR